MVLAAGCGDPAAHVTLVRSNPAGSCTPAGATSLKVIAYAPSGEVSRAVGLDQVVDISDFPADTEQLGVEVLVGGGVVGAIGKSFPLAFGDLEEGATIPVFMTPVAGFCPTGELTEPRFAPLVARAGERVLVIGGTTAGGAPLSSAELYDPATASFAPIAVPELLGQNGFIGSALTSLPDGRVVLSGGPQPVITIFDPVTSTFGELGFIENRSNHSTVAIDERHVLLAGGCSEVTSGTCTPRKSSKLYDLDRLGTYVVGPSLRAARTGAAIFDIGVQADGQRAFVAAGGVASSAELDTADRFTLAEDAVVVAATHAQAAALDGGAVLTAFASDADPADGAATVIVPDAPTAQPIARAPDLAGVRLASLDDGRVLGIAPGGGVTIYDPTRDRWQTTTHTDAIDGPTAASTPTLLALADGSTLVLEGGRAAWIFRGGSVGPSTGSVTVVPSDPDNSHVLTAPDPRTVARSGTGWELIAIDPLARALVGGPRSATGSVLATVRVGAGGVALIAQQVGPGRALVAELAPGTASRLVRLGGDVLCSGRPVPALAPAVAVSLRLAIDHGRARVTLDAAELLSCALDATERGAWGVAALGAGARVAVDTVTVAR